MHPETSQGDLLQHPGEVVCFSQPRVFLSTSSRVGKGEKALPSFRVGDGAQDPKDPSFRVCLVLRTAESSV